MRYFQLRTESVLKSTSDLCTEKNPTCRATIFAATSRGYQYVRTTERSRAGKHYRYRVPRSSAKKWKYPRKKDEVTVDVSQLLDLKLQMSGISVAGTQCSGYWISMILMLKSSRETYSPRITENSSDVKYFWDMQYSNQSYERMRFST